MAFTEAQKVTLQEITGISSLTQLDYYLRFLDDETAGYRTAWETRVGADITLWASIRDSHVKLKGGADGVDFDNERKRAAIRQRTRKALNLPTDVGVGGYAGGMARTVRC